MAFCGGCLGLMGNPLALHSVTMPVLIACRRASEAGSAQHLLHCCRGEPATECLQCSLQPSEVGLLVLGPQPELLSLGTIKFGLVLKRVQHGLPEFSKLPSKLHFWVDIMVKDAFSSVQLDVISWSIPLFSSRLGSAVSCKNARYASPPSEAVMHTEVHALNSGRH